MPVEYEELRHYYDVALDLVMKCGHLMRDGYECAELNFSTKGESYNLVTVYDKEIEDFLIAGLKKEFPKSHFIGEEESGGSKRDAKLTDEPTWIIDPIDGTTNFIHHVPHCCIAVGLAVKKELVVGIVFNPILNEMFSALKGHGAFLNGLKIQVSNCTTMKSAVVGLEVSLIHAPAVRDKHVKRLYKLAANCSGTRGLGSAAISLCYVAKGSFDCFHVDDLQPWDIAGAAVVVREAGGVIYNIQGGEFDIMKPDLVCAGTPELAQEAVKLIDEADKITDYTFK